MTYAKASPECGHFSDQVVSGFRDTHYHRRYWLLISVRRDVTFVSLPNVDTALPDKNSIGQALLRSKRRISFGVHPVIGLRRYVTTQTINFVVGRNIGA